MAHRFLEANPGLESPETHLEGQCDIRGESGYCIIFDGTKDGRPFRVQLVALTRDGNAFFLYGVCEVDAWPQARPWLTAVQSTVKLLEKEPAVPPDPGEADAD